MDLGAWVAYLGLFLSWLGLAVLFGELTLRLRRARRRRLARRARGDDWVCANCLHTEAV